MLHMSNQNVVRIQVNHLLHDNSLVIIWSSFLFLTLNKLLRKPVIFIKSLFYLFWHWFIMQKLQVKMERNISQRFFTLSKKCVPHGCFHNLASFWNCTPPPQMVFGWEQREENNNIAKNSSRSYILTLLTLLSGDVKSALILKVPSLTKAEVRNFPLLYFPRLLCLVHGQLAMSLRRDVWKGRSYVNANVSVSSWFSNGQFYLNPKTAGGFNLNPSCDFSKNVSSKERVKRWDFLWLLILS